MRSTCGEEADGSAENSHPCMLAGHLEADFFGLEGLSRLDTSKAMPTAVDDDTFPSPCCNGTGVMRYSEMPE